MSIYLFIQHLQVPSTTQMTSTSLLLSVNSGESRGGPSSSRGDRGWEDRLRAGVQGSLGGREGAQALRDSPKGPAAPRGYQRGGWWQGCPERGSLIGRFQTHGFELPGDIL